MKNLALFIPALLITTCLFSCKKTDGDMQTTTKTNFKGVVSIAGEWNVKTDSTFSSIGAFGTGKKYTGETGDYFNFGTDGKLYVKEGAKLDTFTYKTLTDSTFRVAPVGAPANVIPFNGFIKPTTATSVVLTWTPGLVNPGSYYSRVVILAK
jgi:hypothetical protein